MTHLITTNGDSLFSTIYPNPGKETILLLHGGPGFPGDLSEAVEILKDRFQLVLFHQRGTKKSPSKSDDYSMEAYLNDIDTIAAYYELPKFHLWGHSWGGVYAQIYAEKHPENILSLFLCCPGSGTNNEWKQTEKEVMQFNKSKCTFWQWTGMGTNSFLGMLGSNNAAKRLYRQVLKNYTNGFTTVPSFEDDLENVRARAMNKTRKAILNYPMLKRQENPPYKITVVYGDQDIYSSSKSFVLNRYPTATVHTINNCGHLPWLHNPEEYSTILQTHFN